MITFNLSRELNVTESQGLMDEPTLVASCGLTQILTESPVCATVTDWTRSYIKSNYRLSVGVLDTHDFGFKAQYVEVLSSQPINIILGMSNSSVLIEQANQLFTIWGTDYRSITIENVSTYDVNTKVTAFGINI